jgi:hypothetical protein
MFKALCRGVLALLLGSILSAAQAAPILVVDAGILTGARNVDVNGTLYDVDFVDGSCTGLFTGCDASTFTFTSQATALQAANALIADVLLDVILNGQLHLFDSDQSLTAGCSSSGCSVLTPFASSGSIVAVAAAVNNAAGGVDFTINTTFPAGFSSPTETYARWSRAAAVVPEPHALACLAIGGFALVLLRRRRGADRTIKHLS